MKEYYNMSNIYELEITFIGEKFADIYFRVDLLEYKAITTIMSDPSSRFLSFTDTDGDYSCFNLSNIHSVHMCQFTEEELAKILKEEEEENND